jgi:hypothetical protein
MGRQWSNTESGGSLLPQLHMEVRTLVSKAAPGPWTELTEIYAGDAFLTALDDGELRRRIMLTCPPPITLAATQHLRNFMQKFVDFLLHDRLWNGLARSTRGSLGPTVAINGTPADA